MNKKDESNQTATKGGELQHGGLDGRHVQFNLQSSSTQPFDENRILGKPANNETKTNSSQTQADNTSPKN